MNFSEIVVKQPWLEVHNHFPFVFSQLHADYAHKLADLAYTLEADLLVLPVTKGWERQEHENPTGSRYGAYNTFLLHPEFQPLFLALRESHRFLLSEIGKPVYSSYVQSWMNIHRQGQRLHRHQHHARFIGSFSAFAEGGFTSYGASPDSNTADHIFPNVDGCLVMTTGPGNYHEVSTWENPDRPRVSYAFDIVDASVRKSNRVFIPFDGISE